MFFIKFLSPEFEDTFPLPPSRTNLEYAENYSSRLRTLTKKGDDILSWCIDENTCMVIIEIKAFCSLFCWLIGKLFLAHFIIVDWTQQTFRVEHLILQVATHLCVTYETVTVCYLVKNNKLLLWESWNCTNNKCLKPTEAESGKYPCATMFPDRYTAFYLIAFFGAFVRFDQFST